MDIQTTLQATSEPPKKMQVNAQLDDEIAEAFDRYLKTSGVGTISAAVRSLLVPRLRELGYLPSEMSEANGDVLCQ